MGFYVNDTKIKATLLVCRTNKEASVYATWANECLESDHVSACTHKFPEQITGNQLLRYFGFTIDTLVEQLFSLLPTRSRVESNVLLIKVMLNEPDTSKSKCCQYVNKYPSHYSRLSKTLGQHCSWIASLSGGRNPMKLLRGIRGDI